MAFSNPFKAKNRVDSTVLVGSTIPKQYKPQRYDVWLKVSGDGQNIVPHVYDDNGNPRLKGTWQRSPKPIVSATDPAGTNEVQSVTLNNTPTGGTFTLSFGGQTTGPIAYNATAATVQTALQALSSIGTNGATVSGSAGGPYTVTFGGNLAYTNVALMTASGSSLTGAGAQPTVTVVEVTAGVNLIVSNSVLVNDVWYNTSGSNTVVRVFQTGNVWK